METVFRLLVLPRHSLPVNSGALWTVLGVGRGKRPADVADDQPAARRVLGPVFKRQFARVASRPIAMTRSKRAACGKHRHEGRETRARAHVVVDRLHAAAHVIGLMPEAGPARILQEIAPPRPVRLALCPASRLAMLRQYQRIPTCVGERLNTMLFSQCSSPPALRPRQARSAFETRAVCGDRTKSSHAFRASSPRDLGNLKNPALAGSLSLSLPGLLAASERHSTHPATVVA